MLQIVKNKVVRFSLVLLTRAAAVCAVVVWQSPQNTFACNNQYPVWVVAGGGGCIACGCYTNARGYNCLPGGSCGVSCSSGVCM